MQTNMALALLRGDLKCREYLMKVTPEDVARAIKMHLTLNTVSRAGWAIATTPYHYQIGYPRPQAYNDRPVVWTANHDIQIIVTDTEIHMYQAAGALSLKCDFQDPVAFKRLITKAKRLVTRYYGKHYHRFIEEVSHLSIEEKLDLVDTITEQIASSLAEQAKWIENDKKNEGLAASGPPF
jgi:hypothetical protein